MTKQQSTQIPIRHWLSLIAICALIAGLWLGLFPAIAQRPNVAERIQQLEEKGIDPTALFYTELEAMPAAEAKIKQIRSGEDDPFW